MGNSVNSSIGYGIAYLTHDEICQDENVLNAMKSKGLKSIYDFFEEVLNEENIKEENPCKLSYKLFGQNDFNYGVFIFQKETRVGAYDSMIHFNPEKLALFDKHDEFLIRVANVLGIYNQKPGWFSVSDYS